MKRVGAETDLVQCPYDKSHRILPHRFQVHLVRCRKNFPLAQVVTCPFNVTHLLKKEELDWHVTVCPERKTFENSRHREEPVEELSTTMDTSFSADNSELQGNQFKVPIDQSNVSTENWEDDPNVPSYNPTAYAENAPVLRMPVGMSPAQRKEFRAAERKRLQSLMK